MKYFRIWFAAIAAGLLAVDQISKWFVHSLFTVSDSHVLVPGVLDFFYTHNTGAAFGWWENGRTVLLVVTSVAIAACLYLMVSRKIHSDFIYACLALIVSGGIGNWIDRVAYGYVIDYLQLKLSWFPFVFNFADCCVVVGGVMLAVYLLIDTINMEKKQPMGDSSAPKPTPSSEEKSP